MRTSKVRTSMVAFAAVMLLASLAGVSPSSALETSATSTFPAPFGTWEALIARISTDLTATPLTPAQSVRWETDLAAGTATPGELVDSMRRGPENSANVDPAVRLYRAFLQRTPDASGLAFWVKRRRSGTWTLTRTAEHFARSTEFERKYGRLTNAAFVRLIYDDVLGRPSDPTGAAYWTRQLDLGRRTRGSVMVGFSESNEYQRKQASNVDVAVAFTFLLGRAPTAVEVSDWVARAKAGTTGAELADELLSSTEYASHISGVAVPGAPTAVLAAGGDGEVALSWTPPASDGGSGITGYVVTPYVAGVAQPSVPYESALVVQDVLGLVNGSSYTFTVAAKNRIGLGAASPPTTAVTPSQEVGTASDLSVGPQQACAVHGGGRIACWGRTFNGYPPDDDRLSEGWTVAPVDVEGIDSAVAVSVGATHACAVISDGSARCWGANSAGQLGDGTMADASAPVRVDGLDDATAVSVGDAHSCALVSDGSVRCWGANGSGRLGDGTTASSPVPVAVSGVAGATRIASADATTCALVGGGSVRCWGSGRWGALGDGTTVDALVADGTARCWGRNDVGQLGDGTTIDAASPVVVAGLSALESIGGGAKQTCATATSGRARCWGDASFGRLGGGSMEGGPGQSVDVSGLTDAVAVDGGDEVGCALRSGGTVRCWGARRYGQSGTGLVGFSTTPVAVRGLVGVEQISTSGDLGGAGTSCALAAGGIVQCWGGHFDTGVPGAGAVIEPRPTTIAGIAGATQVSTGPYHACALLPGGSVRCWGANWRGQLGDGTTVSRMTPVQVSGITGAVAVEAGGQHTCVLLSTGSVRCWGSNADGQLGDGTTEDRLEPVTVGGVAGVTQLSTGYASSCAIVAGSVSCWGEVASFGRRTTPVAIAGVSGASSISVGPGHGCAVVAGGSVRCWGSNAHGELGDGTTTERSMPVTVAGLSHASQVEAGYARTCVLLADGTARCWGANAGGALGDGTTVDRLVPTSVATLPAASSLSSFNLHSCALAADATVYCWGGDGYAELGNAGGLVALRSERVALP